MIIPHTVANTGTRSSFLDEILIENTNLCRQCYEMFLAGPREIGAASDIVKWLQTREQYDKYPS
jgi:hypothetical protein